MDSYGVSANLAAIVLKARALIDGGTSLDSIIKILKEFRGSLRSFIVVSHLENWYRSGGTSRFRYRFDRLFKKPILQLANGKIQTNSRVRGKSNALQRIYEDAIAGMKATERIKFIIVSGNQQDANILYNTLEQNIHKTEGMVLELGFPVGIVAGSTAILLLVHPV